MRKRRALRIVMITVASLIVVVAIGPLLVPVKPLQGLAAAKQLAADDGQFVTVSDEGTDGVEIHLVSSGSDSETGVTFLLLHGSLFNLRTWNRVTGVFDRRGKVIAYDQIPYGLSEKLVSGDWTERSPYTTEATLDRLFRLLDLLGVDGVVLVGHSYGAVLALQAALRQPERVQGLILVDPAVYVGEEMPAWLMNLPQVRRLGPLFARQLGQSDRFLRQTYLNPDRITDERVAMTLVHTRMNNWDAALWEYLRAWDYDSAALVEQIPAVTQPTLVISGENDAITPLEDARRLDSALPTSTLITLPVCGHVPQEECPAAFTEAVDGWLTQVVP